MSLSSLVFLAAVFFSNTMIRITVAEADADARKFHYVMVSGNSAFFEPIEEGWNDACDKFGPDVTCEHFNENEELLGNHNLTYVHEEHGRWCAAFLQHLIQRGDVDGIAAKCNPKEGFEDNYNDATRTWIREAKDAGIPAVVFDGPHEGPYLSYIGTDEFDVGRSMARLLKQLRPEGGTYVAIYHNGGTKERAQGFYEEIEKDNDRENKAHWIEEPSLEYAELGWDDGNDLHSVTQLKLSGGNVVLDGVDAVIPMLEMIASKNPTAILFMYQTPLRVEGFPDFIDSVRDKDITFLGVDGNANNLKLISRGYVDGLIGQQTYDTGLLAAETLHTAVTVGWDVIADNITKTRLISYNIIPDDLPPHQVDQHLLESLKYVGVICFCIVGVLSIYFIGWTLFNRSSKVIMASQPFFLVMIAFGVLTLAAALIPLSFDDDGSSDTISNSKAVGICMSIPWLAFNGFGIIFSSMLAKTWRVNKLFKSSKTGSRTQVSEKDAIALPAVAIILNNIILICWTVLDPLTYKRDFELGTDLWNRDFASNGFCRSENEIAWLIPLGLINLGLMIITCYQAWEARDIQSEFAESKWIGLAVFSMSQGFLTGIPIVIAVAKTQPETFYLTITMLIFVVCMAVLLLIFLPKVVINRRYNRMSLPEQMRTMATSVKVSSGQSITNTTSTMFRVAAAASAATHGLSEISTVKNSTKVSRDSDTTHVHKTSLDVIEDDDGDVHDDA